MFEGFKLGGIQKRIESKIDPLGWGPAVRGIASRAARNPRAVAGATVEYAGTLARIPAAATRVVGQRDAHPPVEVDPRDRRFANPAWRENAAYFAVLQAYLATRNYADGLIAAGAGDVIDEGKTRQLMNLLFDAAAPSNTILNPEVLIKALETGGNSLVRGARFALDDAVQRGGTPLKVDASGFRIGENLAASEGKVVFRNELIEVLQYTPLTDQVHEVPILATPPWINKYYILDLAPGRSLVEWALRHNRTVFMVSYRNPDESMKNFSMDDYSRLGTQAALDVVQEITGAPKVEILSICLGGAMSAMTAAKLAAEGQDRIHSLTMLNTLLDYSEVGELGLMTDPGTLDRIEERMRSQGFLDGAEMAGAFDMIKANDLIFNYWVSRWMKGEKPAAFDILAWNEDSTRMPANMHSQYLRSLYGRNELALGDYVLDGTSLDLGKLTFDVYIVGAVNDHIVPWTSSYRSVDLLGGTVRFVRSNGGHIAGAVNPPGPKAWFEAVGDPADSVELPVDVTEWSALATRHKASWWDDWAAWTTARAGDLVEPPAIGSAAHPPLGDAPGQYVSS